MTYRTLKRQFGLDDAALEDLKEDLLFAHPHLADEDGRGLVWMREPEPPVPTQSATASAPRLEPAPLAYTPPYLAEKIVTSRSTLEGERKQVTVLFADLKGSMELLAERDPEEARQLLDPVLEHMMAAVHRYEGTVNQIMGDGIMALFGAPLAHEDHAVRACYAALAMQEAMQRYAEEVRRTQGLTVQMRVGLNSGEVVVRAIGNDLHMDYSAVGQTTHLAARMEQLATPGSILLTVDTLRLVEGLVRVQGLGPVPVKGLGEPVEVFELIGVTSLRRRLEVAVARGLSPFVGRQPELEAWPAAGPGTGRNRSGAGRCASWRARGGHVTPGLTSSCTPTTRRAGCGWRVALYPMARRRRTCRSVICSKPTVTSKIVVDLQTVRAKITGHILTLDDALQDTVLAVLALFEALPADSPFLFLDPLQRRRRTLEALKRVLLRESQVQPLLLVFEDLH